jgi:hypothetical protein
MPSPSSSPSPSRRSALALALASLAAFAPPLPALASVCFDEYQCITHWISSDRSQEYSFDFRPLCSLGNTVVGNDGSGIVRTPSGDFNWTMYTPEGYRWEIIFNICGNTTAACNPSWAHSFSRGVLIQSWGDPPGGTTTDPETGQTVPTTPACEVLGHTRPEFDFVDPTNPGTGGVILRHSSLPPMQGDPFPCLTNPLTGYPKERNLDIVLLCDSSLTSDNLAPVSFVESKQYGLGTCSYVFTLRTGAACGVSGDPFDMVVTPDTSSNAASNFGYTVLGAFLAVGLQFGFTRAYAGGHLARFGLGGGGGGSGGADGKQSLSSQGRGGYGAV